MIRADALNLHIYPVRMEMNGTKQIPTSDIYFKENSGLKEFLVGKTLSQICSMDKEKSKSIIVDECSTK